MTIDRKMAKKEHKLKELIEQQRLRLEDVSEEEQLDNVELMEDGEKTKTTKLGLEVESSGSDNES